MIFLNFLKWLLVILLCDNDLSEFNCVINVDLIVKVCCLIFLCVLLSGLEMILFIIFNCLILWVVIFIVLVVILVKLLFFYNNVVVFLGDIIE